MTFVHEENGRMKTCDKCQYCYKQSNHYKGAEIHTIHYRCHLIEKAVNPYYSCEMWKERKGKMKIRYKDGYVEEVKE